MPLSSVSKIIEYLLRGMSWFISLTPNFSEPFGDKIKNNPESLSIIA
jgi:hypothetical protein